MTEGPSKHWVGSLQRNVPPTPIDAGRIPWSGEGLEALLQLCGLSLVDSNSSPESRHREGESQRKNSLSFTENYLEKVFRES